LGYYTFGETEVRIGGRWSIINAKSFKRTYTWSEKKPFAKIERTS